MRSILRSGHRVQKVKEKRRPGAKGIDCEDPEGDDDSDEEDYPYEVEDSQEQEQEYGQDDDDDQNSQSQPEEGASMVKAILTEMKKMAEENDKRRSKENKEKLSLSIIAVDEQKDIVKKG